MLTQSHTEDINRIIKNIENNTNNIITIKNREMEEDFHVSIVGCKQVIFQNVTFNKTFKFVGCTDLSFILMFKDCIFLDSMFVSDNLLNTFEFIRCAGKIGFITNGAINNVCHLEGVSFEEIFIYNINFNNLSILYSKNLSINMANIICDLFLFYGNLERFKLSTNGNTKAQTRSVIKQFNLGISSSLEGSISINGFNIEKLLIRGKADKILLDFVDNNFKDIVINNLINGGSIKFSNVNFLDDATITIIESDLGKAVLFGIDFDQVKAFSIGTVNLNDVVYSGIKWCKRIITMPEKPMSFAQLRETYKQLKNVTAKQNDKPEELRFHSLEMRSYKQELKSISKRWNDKIILYFNEWTNDHGQSWVQPFFTILGIIIAIYFPIKILLGFTTFNIAKTPTAIAEMMECFNPIRKFNDSFGLNKQPLDNNSTAWAKVLDIFFLRLVVGLLIFQMVKAFRKYIR